MERKKLQIDRQVFPRLQENVLQKCEIKRNNFFGHFKRKNIEELLDRPDASENDKWSLVNLLYVKYGQITLKLGQKNLS